MCVWCVWCVLWWVVCSLSRVHRGVCGVCNVCVVSVHAVRVRGRYKVHYYTAITEVGPHVVRPGSCPKSFFAIFVAFESGLARRAVASMM